MGFFNDVNMNEGLNDFVPPQEGIEENSKENNNIKETSSTNNVNINSVNTNNVKRKNISKSNNNNSGIFGNVDGEDISLENVRIVGNIIANGFVNIGEKTVIIGDITTKQGVVISGAINGNIDAQGHVLLTNTAIIKGDIRSKSVEIQSGAILDGACSQCYADVDIATFFNEKK